MDAAQYRQLLIPLLWLKYLSESCRFHKGGTGNLNYEDFDPDGRYWMPKISRWSHVVDHVSTAPIGEIVNKAFLALSENKTGSVQQAYKFFARGYHDLDPESNKILAQLITLFSGDVSKGGLPDFFGEGFENSQDLLGYIYEYFTGKFAQLEKRGGEFYTPKSVVRLLVDMIQPFDGDIYDGCCGTGGMFFQDKKLKQHLQERNFKIYGQEANAFTWSCAVMNLEHNRLFYDVGDHNQDTLLKPLHVGVDVGYCITNPPFNLSKWEAEKVGHDPRWLDFSDDSKPSSDDEAEMSKLISDSNANFAWIQHHLFQLRKNGIAGIVMSNSCLSTNKKEEKAARKAIILGDKLDCVVMLPNKLFTNTGISACLIILANDKSSDERYRSREGETLFIDCRNMKGNMLTRTLRELVDDELSKIATTYTNWRSRDNYGSYRDESGFCNVENQTNIPNQFIIFNTNEINEILDIQLIENQNFHQLRNTDIQANYIIIGPEQFRDAAIELLEIRNPAIYASLERIYDEFSAGNPDPMAIRSFIQWSQEYWVSPNPNSVLLLGDGGYDYRNINGLSSIIVPTIQVQSTRSYATDDLLSSIYGNIPEVATGRYPAKNIQEVSNFIEKVKKIENNPTFGPWRQKVTLIADDASRPEPNHGSIATGQSHTLNSEQIANLIPSTVNIEKLYMMEYPEVNDASAYGVIKPDATEALFNNLNNGTAIISYIGHGSPYQLAQEKLLDLNRGDINQINTGDKLPLWIVGTCSFGWFDDPLNESFSEVLIKSEMNAASMVISTTRAITVVGNERYTKDLFENIFTKGKVNNQTVGTILQSIKDGTAESQYFHLFGDPGMRVPMPRDTLLSLNISPDTLKTLAKGTFYGQQTLIPESGNGYVTLIDANRDVVRNYDILSETYSLSYSLPGANLFRGQFSFLGTNFEGEVRIPLDISYSDNLARLIIYLNNDKKDIMGVINSIKLEGGTATQDNQGPIIVFENSSGVRLEENDHLEKNKDLIIRITDPIGINLTNELGHEIIFTNLDNQELYNKTNDFSYDQNSIVTGKILFPTTDKNINLKIKAWDNANNPSEKSIKIYRSQNNFLKIYNVYNFPNPFSDFTQFTFELSKSSNIKIDIYSIGGKKIYSLEKINAPTGFNIINWNGNNIFGDQIANGVYIYHLKAITMDEKTSFLGRIAKFK